MKWFSILAHGRAMEALTRESPKDAWKAMYRAKRLEQRNLFESLNRGEVGCLYGVRVVVSKYV